MGSGGEGELLLVCTVLFLPHQNEIHCFLPPCIISIYESVNIIVLKTKKVNLYYLLV